MFSLINFYFKKKRKYKILDFGGGWGIGYANLLEVFDKKTLSNIDYHIYELTDLCDIGDKKFKKKLNLKHNLKYFDNLESIDKNYDIIFFGSSIQYLKDPLETLKEILLKNSEYIVLIDLYLTNSKTFFTRQQHYNFEAPHSFINLKQFENIFYKKYNIINKSYSHTTRLNKIGNLDMGNFEKKFRIKNSFNYIFKSK
ncbi:methyltransferase, TIGR04325 family [Candidatus Pelagibacter bacterium nBUS_25]|uniref:methyltransferase, TIGR04325 family n=1 Tax=Candidatus Pelagibacter bacterium nBUS_25 TaxID=3374187 RepID=UPI003EBDA530